MNESLKSRKNELITKTHPKSPITEAFRSIRTNLNFISPDNPLETIIFTSSGAGEGKSLIVSNMAVSLAQNEKKVIIIDADLRKPVQHYFYGIPNLKGLSNILTNEIKFSEGLTEIGINNVKLISAGPIPPNPAELLDSNKMKKVIEKAKKEADIVLIDVPPVLVVTDAVLLSNKVDGVVMVVASHQTHNDMLIKARESLKRVNANVVGAILNKFPVQKDSNYYYRHYYESYYSYYGKEERS